MSLAEFNFANIDPSSSARHDWKNQVKKKVKTYRNIGGTSVTVTVSPNDTCDI